MDIAQIGFKVDTSDLDKGSTALTKLQQAAMGMTTASAKMTAAIQGSNSAMDKANVAAAQASTQRALANETLKRLQATKQASQEDIKAAREALKKRDADLAAAVTAQKRAKEELLLARALKTSRTADSLAFGKTTSVQTMSAGKPQDPSLVVNNGPSIPRDERPNKFNTANIAAQFQDIGVTAAMGMNPLTIALQQGTQLSAIMNSMQSPLKGLGEAFKQVFNTVSLGTIAIVALVAAGLQMVNWLSVAKGLLNGLATAIQYTAPYFAVLAAGLALAYSPTIGMGLYNTTIAIIKMGRTALKTGAQMAAAWAMANPVAALVVGTVAVVAIFQAMGNSILGTVKNVVNGIFAGFAGAFAAIKELWGSLPTVMGNIIVTTLNVILAGLSELINGSVDMLNSMIDAIPDWAKPKNSKITWQADFLLENPHEKDAADAGKKAGEAFNAAVRDTFNKDLAGQIGKSLQNGANGIANSIRKYAAGLGVDTGQDATRGKTDLEKFKDIENHAKREIESLKAKQAALGMTDEAALRLKHTTDLLNEAQQKGIELTPTGVRILSDYAAQMAQIETQTKRVKEAQDFLRDTAKGFFSDMKSGLQEGKSLWKSFGDAVTNVLNKILDAILNSGINAVFKDFFAGSGTGSGKNAGILRTIGDFLFSAKGNAFDQGGVQAFANGGTFTNSIVNHATPFMFAKGGAMGIMGEAGPEAVIPLHRGPDGSLGVRMAGGGGGDQLVNVNIINNGNSNVSTKQRQTSSGIEIEVMIDDMISQKISEQGSSTNRSLNARENRRLIAR